MKVIVFVLLVLCHFCLKAQIDYRPGYVIKSNGDSVTGFVAYQLSSTFRVCKFRSQKHGQTTKYQPSDIKAFGYLHDRRFESIDVDRGFGPSMIFAEAVVKGLLSLYRAEGEFLIQRQAEKIQLLPRPRTTEIETSVGIRRATDRAYVNQLNIALSDCSIKTDKIKYNIAALGNLIQDYNRCKGAEGRVYKALKRKLTFTWQVFGGMNMSNYSLVTGETFKKSTSFFPGISADIALMRSFDRLLVSTEVWYSDKSYYGSREFADRGPSDFHEYYLDLSSIKIPLGFRYNFVSDYNTLYVKAGIIAVMPIRGNLKTIIKRQNGSVVNTRVTASEFDSGSNVGVYMSAGFSKLIYRKTRVFVEVRYDRTNSSGWTESFNSFPKTVDLNLIFGLRF